MLIKDYNLTMLDLRKDYTNQINSIKDLTIYNNVQSYYNLEGIKNLVFTVTKLLNLVSKDIIQKYYSLQAIYNSKRKKYNKVSNYINLIVY